MSYSLCHTVRVIQFVSYSLSVSYRLQGTLRRYVNPRLGYISNWVRALAFPMLLDLKTGPLFTNNLVPGQGSPVLFIQFQMAPRFRLLISSGSKKKKPRYARLSEAKVSHPHKMWDEVPSSAPHLLYVELFVNPTSALIVTLFCYVTEFFSDSNRRFC